MLIKSTRSETKNSRAQFFPQRRGCASLEKYVEQCVPLLGRCQSFALLSFLIFELRPKTFFRDEMFEMFRCLGPGTVEEIVAREGEELISRFLKTNAENYLEAICGLTGGTLKKFILFIPRVEEGVRQSPGSEKFSHRFCQVKLLCQKNQIFIIYISRCLEDIFLEPATAVSALRWGDDHHGDNLCENG